MRTIRCLLIAGGLLCGLAVVGCTGLEITNDNRNDNSDHGTPTPTPTPTPSPTPACAASGQACLAPGQCCSGSCVGNICQ